MTANVNKERQAWPILMAVSWLFAIQMLADLRQPPGRPEQHAPGLAMLTFGLQAIVLIALVMGLARLDATLEGREGWRLVTILTFVVGIFSAAGLLVT